MSACTVLSYKRPVVFNCGPQKQVRRQEWSFVNYTTFRSVTAGGLLRLVCCHISVFQQHLQPPLT